MVQGVLTPEGYIQCAYHGWKLSGDTGACKEIPQLPPGEPGFERSAAKAMVLLEMLCDLCFSQFHWQTEGTGRSHSCRQVSSALTSLLQMLFAVPLATGGCKAILQMPPREPGSDFSLLQMPFAMPFPSECEHSSPASNGEREWGHLLQH